MDTLISLLFSSSTLLIHRIRNSRSPWLFHCLSFAVVLGLFVKSCMSTLPGVPRVAQCKFVLPLCLVCCPTTASKNAKYKITVDTNKPPINLSEAFPGTPSQTVTTLLTYLRHLQPTVYPKVIYIRGLCVSMCYLVLWTNIVLNQVLYVG